MTMKQFALLILVSTAIAACSTGQKTDDRTAINAIADDIEKGVGTGDLLMIEQHMSIAAKRQGYEANRFVVESSYGPSGEPVFTARTIKVMGDSAHLAFVLMPMGMQFSDSLPRSIVRLAKDGTWKISSFHLTRNRLRIDPDSLL